MAVVGGGLAGISAAFACADAGAEVTFSKSASTSAVSHGPSLMTG